ncbi:MAG: CatB-related O-acetyltransferase [Candidatus Thermoplasmatota archaeon]|nr:CatB-related O-acetyltransferase [Candidatus Thermoplasmatota archaeon]
MRNQFESTLLRDIFKRFYRIDIGMYSYGCFTPERIRPGVKIGRYCSFGPDIKIYNANHPLHFISTHPYLYAKQYGVTDIDLLDRHEVIIGDDVWIGANVVILPSVKNIGTGAILGAGSIVTKDVPAFAVVVGNPAKVIKYRFPEDIQKVILESNIYKMDKTFIKRNLEHLFDSQYFSNIR